MSFPATGGRADAPGGREAPSQEPRRPDILIPPGAPRGIARLMSDSEPTGLQCLLGRPAPDGLGGDLLSLFELPQPVQDAFLEVLGVKLSSPPTEQQQRRVLALCQQNEVEPKVLDRPAEAAGFLMIEAARRGLDDEAFASDLAKLAGAAEEAGKLVELLVPGYRQAFGPLRQQMLAKTVLEHGKLVEHTHWRIDQIMVSEHADALDTPIAVLSFAYRDASKQDRITLHFMPDQLAELRAVCDRMLQPRG